MKHIRRHLTVGKITLVLLLAIFLTGLISVGSLRAQLKKEEVNFEYMAAVTIKSGDTLSKLAGQYYKDPMRWKYIADMNKIRNERRIPIGTVVYIPIEDAKKIAKETEKVIEAKKVAVDESTLKLAELQKELDRIKKEYEGCLAKINDLMNTLKEKDALIVELQDKISALDKQIEAQAELEARLEDMRIAAKSTAERKDELSGSLKEKDAAIAEKEARIADMEWKLKQSQSEVSKYEEANKELKMKIEQAENNKASMEERPSRAKHVSDSRSRIAAMAIALVGSIIWMASDK